MGGYPGNTYVMLSVLPKSAQSHDEKHVLENLPYRITRLKSILLPSPPYTLSEDTQVQKAT